MEMGRSGMNRFSCTNDADRTGQAHLLTSKGETEANNQPCWTHVARNALRTPRYGRKRGGQEVLSL
jgi:hypothetical protein